MSRGALCLFAKEPVPGRVKTRMSPPLSPAEAAALYAAMLDDTIAATADFARRLDLAARIQFDPPEAEPAFRARLERLAGLDSRSAANFSRPDGTSRVGLRPQRGEGLGARMANAFAEMQAEGSGPMLLRGSDSPGLGLERVDEALSLLEGSAEVVLTPDQDGGYAMIGLKKPHNELFQLEYSTSSVLAETIAAAKRSGLSVALTRACFDLDVVADWAWLDRLPPAQSSVLCPRSVESIRLFRAKCVL